MRRPAVQVRMDSELYIAAEAYAAETGRTLANLLRHALIELLSRRTRWSAKTQSRLFPGQGKGSPEGVADSAGRRSEASGREAAS